MLYICKCICDMCKYKNRFIYEKLHTNDRYKEKIISLLVDN